jgi:sugar lactone lactonase YvrE
MPGGVLPLAAVLAACSNLSSFTNGGGDSGAKAEAGDTGAVDAGTCADDPCVMATGLNKPYFTASDSENVYWTENGSALGTGDGAVKSCPVSGCGAGPLVYAQGLTNPVGIATDGMNVYFAVSPSNPSAQGSVQSCPVRGCNGAPTVLASSSSPEGIALDATYLYWVDGVDSGVYRVKKTGGSRETLYDGSGALIAGGFGCAVDSTFVYVLDFQDDLTRIPLAGGSPENIGTAGNVSAGDAPLALGTTGGVASYYYAIPGQVLGATEAAPNHVTVLLPNLTAPSSLAFDESTSVLYWTDYGSGMAVDGRIGKVNADGTGQVILGSALDTPESITVSGAYAFWFSFGTPEGSAGVAPSTGTLTRVAR